MKTIFGILLAGLSGCTQMHAQRCASYGLQYGSNEYAECMMRAADRQQRASEMLMTIGNQRPQRNKTMTCQTFGNTTNCF